MFIYNSCKPTVQSCLDTQTFSMARLFNDERTMSSHIHECYEIYFSISGGKQFLIDGQSYEFAPGDIFFINQSESHCLSEVDPQTHERIVLFIHPEYLKRLSTQKTDLSNCFTCRGTSFGHRIGLSEEEQGRFTYYMYKMSESKGFGQDIMDQAAFLELMTFLNRIFLARCDRETALEMDNGKQSLNQSHYALINSILSYIHQNLSEELTIQHLAGRFYLSNSYLCKLFKDATGTTINRYIVAKRISLARDLLAEGCSVADSCRLCGFKDYSNFLKAFTKAVGVSPKKYASYGH